MLVRAPRAAAPFILCLVLASACGEDDPGIDGGVGPAADGGGGDHDAAAVDATVPGVDAGPPAALPVVWFSDWRTATGTDTNALYDGEKWTDQLCNAEVAEVVDAAGLGFPTPHAYRTEYRDPGECLMVQVTGAWDPPAPGEYLFVRAYYRNAIPDGEEIGFPHPLHIGRSGSPAAAYSTWVNFAAPAAGESSMTLQLGGGPEWPDRHWSYGFRTGQTYRIELRIHRVTESTAAADVRVYDAAGALVADSTDWDNGEVGDNFRTLADSAPVYPVTDESFTLLELGNNDPSGLVAGTERYVYWAALAVVVSDDPEHWPGPYPTAAEATP